MVIHKKIACEALSNCHMPDISCFVLLNDSQERDTINIWRASTGCVYIHVDDFIFTHGLEDVCNRAALVVAAALKAVGFVVEFTPTYKLQKVVGLAVGADGDPTLTVPLIKVGDLDRALEILSEAEFVLPALVRTVVAVYCWYGLMWRACFSAVGPLHQWIARHIEQGPIVPWAGVRSAFRRMRALLPFIHASLDRKLAPLLLAQDAAGGSSGAAQGPNGSFSLTAGFPCLLDISKIFHLLQLRCRSSASFGRVLQKAGEQAFEMGLGDFVSRTPIPFHVFLTRWFQIGAGRWRRLDHINLGETRTAVLWGAICSRITRWRHTAFLCVGDNMAANGCLTGGRSPDPSMNHQCFKRAAVEALYDRRFLYPWCPSALQPGDWGTRDGLDETILATAAGRVLALFPGCLVILLWFSSFGGHTLRLEERLATALKKCTARTVKVENSGNSSYSLLAAGGRARVSHIVDGGRVRLSIFVLGFFGKEWWAPHPNNQGWSRFDLGCWLSRVLIQGNAVQMWVVVYCLDGSEPLPTEGGPPWVPAVRLKFSNLYTFCAKVSGGVPRVADRAQSSLNGFARQAGYVAVATPALSDGWSPGDSICGSRSAGLLCAPTQRPW
jgi:hypothetical protein